MAIIGIINGEVDASKAISETDDELVIQSCLGKEHLGREVHFFLLTLDSVQ